MGYPLIPDDLTFPNIPAPERGTERTGAYFAGNHESSPQEPRDAGKQPGYDVAGVSPMSPSFGREFGNQPG